MPHETDHDATASHSLLDFAQLMRTFETRKVAFVSVTQQFNVNVRWQIR